MTETGQFAFKRSLAGEQASDRFLDLNRPLGVLYPR
jgi:hypothetical protein